MFNGISDKVFNVVVYRWRQLEHNVCYKNHALPYTEQLDFVLAPTPVKRYCCPKRMITRDENDPWSVPSETSRTCYHERLEWVCKRCVKQESDLCADHYGRAGFTSRDELARTVLKLGPFSKRLFLSLHVNLNTHTLKSHDYTRNRTQV